MLNDDLLRGDSMGEKTKEKQEVRISEKLLLSINEANALSGIGQNKLRELTLDPRCPFVLFVGRKLLKPSLTRNWRYSYRVLCGQRRVNMVQYNVLY